MLHGYTRFVATILPAMILFIGCAKNQDRTVPTPQIIDFTGLITKSAGDYVKASPAPASVQAILADRLKQQEKILAAFDRDPDAFLKKYPGGSRTFVFDAVVDPIVMRIGTIVDGGKWIANPQKIRQGDIVYSFGVGHDVSFDLEMAGRFGCYVYMFDPSPTVINGFTDFKSPTRLGMGNISYQPLGLGPVSLDPARKWDLVIEGQKCPVKDLSQIAASLKHDHVDILKIDVEGGEVPALLDMLASDALTRLRVKLILVEIHFWDDDQFRGFVRIVGGLKKQGYLLYRKEFNPGDGYRCGEYAFMRM